ncbi:hypothetical protein [Sporisorium scitamineum]|uniref:HTH APSES-type domain-containing protein n=1 Tax=Sporisorium scitamineum TaxID=49012 RepID=A0A0F7SAW9_9BASI|nr:hypothetical protein [Sporisorium scitamineum]
MPVNKGSECDFGVVASIAKKRGLPYSRKELETTPQHLNQTSFAGNEPGGSLYISGPRQAVLFPTKMHDFRMGKYATTGGERGSMTAPLLRRLLARIKVRLANHRFHIFRSTTVNFGRLVRACPALGAHITKLKGGYLSIQGTWLPYDLAKELSRRIAWDIREDLVPLFGYDFPSTCLRPDSEGFGQLAIGAPLKRVRKRHNNGGPHQTSCYGPSMPISVVDGQAVERTHPHPYQQPTAATFHYSKGLHERSHWFGDQALPPHATAGNMESMMWPTTAPFGPGGASTQPGLGSAGPMQSTYAAKFPGLDANGSSPILSSPPSSNASSSIQSTTANYGLMMPPTVPSHAFGTGPNDGTTGSSNFFDLQHVAPLAKKATAEEARGYSGIWNPCGYAGTGQLSTWSDSNQTSANVSTPPTPPTPVPHGGKLDSWYPASA